MSLRKLSYELSTKDMKRLQARLKEYAREIEVKAGIVAQEAGKFGVERALKHLDALVYSRTTPFQLGRLKAGMRLVPTNRGVRIISGAKHSAVVEFGTGIKGGRASHVLSSERGWLYRDTPWTWYSQEVGEWIIDYEGFPSRPFMYSTMMDLREYIPMKLRKLYK